LLRRDAPELPRTSHHPTGCLTTRKLINDHIVYPFHPSLYTLRDPGGPRGYDVDYSIVEQLIERDEIWSERGRAIQCYAILEQALSALFAHLSDTNEAVAATIFYKITSTSSRIAIIEKLLHRKHGTKFNPFWNGYIKALRPIDTKRNEIVHWVSAAISKIGEDGAIVCGTILIPSNVHSFYPAMQYLSQHDLMAFYANCVEFSRICNIFSRISKSDRKQLELDAWMDTFQQPFLYPLPADHLLYKMPPAPQTPAVIYLVSLR
jgi:hypothetical protein